MKTAKEVLTQKVDGVPKYWIGQYGEDQKVSVKDAIAAMEEYASIESAFWKNAFREEQRRSDALRMEIERLRK